MKTKNYFLKLVLGIFSIFALIILTVPLANAAGPTINTTGFNDVSLKHKNVKAIHYLQDNKVVVGYEDGTFKPEQKINRAEFLKIVMEVSNFSIEGKNCYPDVKDQWFAPYICAATSQNLVDGYPDGTFKPEQDINFAEASKIIANVLKLETSQSQDVWFRPYVISLEKEQAIPDDINSFESTLTRSQMAEMIWRIDADRTYKLSKTYNDILNKTELDSKLQDFGSCQELHDYFQDNANPPYYTPDAIEIPKNSIPVAPMMSEKGGCFTGETKILMSNGDYKFIKDIKAGDKILTKKDKESSQYIEGNVNSTVSHYVPGYLLINQNLEVTPEHVVLVNGLWNTAGNIKVGDYMMNRDGSKIKVNSIQEVEEPTWVYNFEVDQYHTYLANNYYVHNDKGMVGSEDYSSTNVQVSGVDEADVVKNDGKYIYMLKGNTVRIIEAYPVTSMEEVNSISFDDQNFWPNELYLDKDMLVVIGNTYDGNYFDGYDKSLVNPSYYYHNGSTKVYIFNIANRENISLTREITLEGDYNSSRKIGNVLYTVVDQDNYVWPWNNAKTWTEDDLVPLIVDNGTLDKMVECTDVKYMPRQIDETNYMIVAAIPLDKNSPIEKEVIIGSSSEIYASTENLYVAQQKYSWYGWYDENDDKEETYIHKFKLDNTDITYKGMGTVPGSILNQFSMDEYDRNFRIATTLGNVWDEENPSKNNIYILNPNLDTIGKLEGLAPGERIYSARFMGKKGYLVTFKKVDPLFVIGLDDPKNPKVLGELKIPGFSDYLHPYDENHIIGFGLDTQEASAEEIESRGIDFAWYQGIKMAMFDVSDVKNPTQKHIEIIGDRGTNSPLNSNHKALLWSWSKGVNGGALMAFPITVTQIPQSIKDDPQAAANTYGDAVFQGAYVYDVNPKDGFTLRGTITQYDEEIFSDTGYYWYGPQSIERIVYIGNYLYTLSQTAVKANLITGELRDINSIDLAQ